MIQSSGAAGGDGVQAEGAGVAGPLVVARRGAAGAPWGPRGPSPGVDGRRLRGCWG